jgi:hypothetical protein
MQDVLRQIRWQAAVINEMACPSSRGDGVVWIGEICNKAATADCCAVRLSRRLMQGLAIDVLAALAI